MNETFIRKNDIGVDIEYTIVARYKSDERDYIIYTDYVSDDEFGLRLFVDLVNSNNTVPLSESGRRAILDQFKDEIMGIINSNK